MTNTYDHVFRQSTAFRRAGMLFIEPVTRWKAFARNVWRACACPDDVLHVTPIGDVWHRKDFLSAPDFG